ncbi:MAG: L-fucose mutarotase [Firmicutes bacterium]|nr:L-fucose mutarotase [Bacillota bacterium]
MLKGIPKIISPELIKVLMEMGHGEELVIADGNFPVGSCAQRVVRADGLNVPGLLDAILPFFPLDQYVKAPVVLMAVVPGDEAKTPIWDEYRQIIKKYAPNGTGFEFEERFAFYERARKAYAVVATSEPALYANIILKKGVVAG